MLWLARDVVESTFRRMPCCLALSLLIRYGGYYTPEIASRGGYDASRAANLPNWDVMRLSGLVHMEWLKQRSIPQGQLSFVVSSH
jgi:hypothetical protein